MLLYGKCECFVMHVLYVCVCLCCLYLVSVLNAAFYMAFSLLMLVEDARGDNMEEAYTRAGLMTFMSPSVYSILFL